MRCGVCVLLIMFLLEIILFPKETTLLQSDDDVINNIYITDSILYSCSVMWLVAFDSCQQFCVYSYCISSSLHFYIQHDKNTC